MADIWIKVLAPADSYALLTLDELKVILNLPLDRHQRGRAAATCGSISTAT